MATHSDTERTVVPLDGLVFGYGPMLPFVAAAAATWTMPPPWPALATNLVMIWGAIILVFVAGVRRGYGFGSHDASTVHEVATMLVYFILGGGSLVLAGAHQPAIALSAQLAGYILVPVLDRRAAFSGDAPSYFSKLRVPQMLIALVAIAAVLVRLVSTSNVTLSKV